MESSRGWWIACGQVFTWSSWVLFAVLSICVKRDVYTFAWYSLGESVFAGKSSWGNSTLFSIHACHLTSHWKKIAQSVVGSHPLVFQIIGLLVCLVAKSVAGES